MSLEARGIELGYGERPVVSGLDLKLLPGSMTAVIGANGSGKSTILKALARVLKPDHGTVLLDGRGLRDWPRSLLARSLALLPQVHGQPEDLTVMDLVSYGRYPHHGAPGNDKSKDQEAIGQALRLTSLEGLSDRLLTQLSGGERQRAWLALSLAQEPSYLLLDEPTTFLDIRYQLEVLDLVRELNRALGLTVVMVLHDLNHAARYADRIIAIRQGSIIADGAPEEVIVPRVLREAFGIVGVVSRECGYPHVIPTGRCQDGGEPEQQSIRAAKA
jgi:iron complex transport system ATP-binding protein